MLGSGKMLEEVRARMRGSKDNFQHVDKYKKPFFSDENCFSFKKLG